MEQGVSLGGKSPPNYVHVSCHYWSRNCGSFSGRLTNQQVLFPESLLSNSNWKCIICPNKSGFTTFYWPNISFLVTGWFLNFFPILTFYLSPIDLNLIWLYSLWASFLPSLPIIPFLSLLYGKRLVLYGLLNGTSCT